MTNPTLAALPDDVFQADENGKLLVKGSTETVLAEAERPFTSPLPQQGMLVVEGPDAAKFLQGQLTCDIEEIDGYNATLGAHCTPKGRMVASFRIAQLAEDCYGLCLPTESLPLLEASLNKYIVFSKATATNKSNEWLAFGLSGEGAAAVADSIAGGLPEIDNAQFTFEGGALICIENKAERYELWLKADGAGDVVAGLLERLAPASTLAWELQQVKAGIGMVEPATSDAFVPQMLNYDELKGISFNKGCYTGQEIVARAHYRGGVKRHLHVFEATSDRLALAGDEVQDSQGRDVGTIVTSVLAEPNKLIGLYVLKDSAEGKDLNVNGAAIS